MWPGLVCIYDSRTDLAVVCGRDGFVDEAVQEELKPQHSVVRVEHCLGPALRLQTPDQNDIFINIF